MEHFVRGVSRDEMAGFELTVWTAVRGYHIYKDSWAPTVGEDSSATKNGPMDTTGTPSSCLANN